MKKVLIAIITIFALGMTQFNANAQTAKFAHIDYLEVVDSIPTWLDANKQLDDFIAMGQKTIGDMEKDLQTAYDLYLSEKDGLSPLLIEYREKELMEKQELLGYKKEALENDLQIWNQRLFLPIEENLKKAIETIAVKFGITYMFEKSSMLYTAPTGGLDLTKEVRAELIRLEKIRMQDYRFLLKFLKKTVSDSGLFNLNKVAKSRVFLILVAAFCMLSISASISAKKTTWAYYYYDVVIEGILIDSSTEMQEFRRLAENTITQLEEYYNGEFVLYEKGKDTISEWQKELSEKRLEDIRELIEFKKESLKKDLEIFGPRLEDSWLYGAVNEVSQEHKVTFVNDENHDCSSRPVDAINLTTEVRQAFLKFCQCEGK